MHAAVRRLAGKVDLEMNPDPFKIPHISIILLPIVQKTPKTILPRLSFLSEYYLINRKIHGILYSVPS